MGFIKNLTFSRFIILVSFIGAAVFGWLDWKKYQELEMYEHAVEKAPFAVAQNITKARELNELMDTASGVNFGVSDTGELETYITKAALHPSVRVGQIGLGKPKTKNVGKGIVDVTYSVTPAKNGKKEFTRTAISNFAFELEQKSQRVKVTSLEITASGKKPPKPYEVLEDKWKFKLDATVRIKEDE